MNPIDYASSDRSLATIQTISAIAPIEGADAIELAKVLGWQCVSKKGEFKPGDKAVYFEVDSFLPEDARYEFLRKSSFRKTDLMGTGFRIKTIKLRGQLSQGLLLPLGQFPEIETDIEIGADVTELLGVKKWYVPEVQTSTGVMIGDKPYNIPTTDEIRIQSAPDLIDKIKGQYFYITTKMDGTSCTAYWKNGHFGCTSRNNDVKESADALYWAPEQKYGLREKLSALGKNIAIQGELCGPGIQKNKLKLKDYKWYIFDIVDLDTLEYYSYPDLQAFCGRLNLDMAPVECAEGHPEQFRFDYSLANLLELAKGKYESGADKEGIVVRSIGMKPRISFKVLNNDALLKEKD